MFVAGIEIFFGLVAGAILLVTGLAVLYGGFYIAASALKGIYRIVTAHPAWTISIAIYLMMTIAFADSDSPTLVGVSGVMWTILVIGFFILILAARGARQPTSSSPQK